MLDLGRIQRLKPHAQLAIHHVVILMLAALIHTYVMHLCLYLFFVNIVKTYFVHVFAAIPVGFITIHVITGFQMYSIFDDRCYACNVPSVSFVVIDDFDVTAIVGCEFLALTVYVLRA